MESTLLRACILGRNHQGLPANGAIAKNRFSLALTSSTIFTPHTSKRAPYRHISAPHSTRHLTTNF